MAECTSIAWNNNTCMMLLTLLLLLMMMMLFWFDTKDSQIIIPFFVFETIYWGDAIRVTTTLTHCNVVCFKKEQSVLIRLDIIRDINWNQYVTSYFFESSTKRHWIKMVLFIGLKKSGFNTFHRFKIQSHNLRDPGLPFLLTSLSSYIFILLFYSI